MNQIAAKADASTLTLVSSSGKRMYPRVDCPLTVAFDDGARRQARDWSIAGFSLADGGLPSSDGAVYRVSLHLALADCDLVMEADAKVSWSNAGNAVGFRFVGLMPDKARILDHFVQSRFEGDAAIVGGLPLSHRALNVRQPGGRTQRWGHNLAQGAKLLLIVGAVAAGGLYVGARFLTVTTDYAAVAADLQQVHAPAAGFLRSDVLAVGAHVKAGQAIGWMQPVATPQVRLSTETEIAVLRTTLDQQNSALEQAKAGFATFVQASRTDLQEATTARATLDMQTEAEQRIYQRLLSLKETGVVPAQRIDQEQQVLLGLQRSLSTARDLEATMHEKLANAEAGRFSSDGRSTQKAPADIEQDLRTTEATMDRLKTMLAGLDQPMGIVSPCDCTVTALSATANSYVTVGAPVAELARDTEGSATVDALVQNPRLALVRQGQTVTVYLPNRAEGISGRVTGLNFNPANTGRTGLPSALRTLDDYGLMTVDLGVSQDRLMAGLPVTVMAPIEWRALVSNLPAAAWIGRVADGAAGAGRTLQTTARPFYDKLKNVCTAMVARLWTLV